MADGIKATKLKEKDIQRQIKDYLEFKGWFVAVTSTPAMTAATKGLPDLIAVKKQTIGRRTLWIEVKGPRGQQSEAQLNFEMQLKGHGGEYLLARSVEDVQGYLR